MNLTMEPCADWGESDLQRGYAPAVDFAVAPVFDRRDASSAAIVSTGPASGDHAYFQADAHLAGRAELAALPFSRNRVFFPHVNDWQAVTAGTED
ncbi:MAG: hypothetical protein ABS76_37350 [Pelagibacterium sp. SCN 64-44]|nr:MAG: hypothetical protein ABS76_37350 [Pelagibacterium sp. SCN 64-44]